MIGLHLCYLLSIFPDFIIHMHEFVFFLVQFVGTGIAAIKRDCGYVVSLDHKDNSLLHLLKQAEAYLGPIQTSEMALFFWK